jgi:hypothetical protein
MLYIAFIKSRPGLTSETDIVAKSRKVERRGKAGWIENNWLLWCTRQ